jgi:hypothetical protein
MSPPPKSSSDGGCTRRLVDRIILLSRLMLLNMMFPLAISALKEVYQHKIGGVVKHTVTWRTIAEATCKAFASRTFICHLLPS